MPVLIASLAECASASLSRPAAAAELIVASVSRIVTLFATATFPEGVGTQPRLPVLMLPVAMLRSGHPCVLGSRDAERGGHQARERRRRAAAEGADGHPPRQRRRQRRQQVQHAL